MDPNGRDQRPPPAPRRGLIGSLTGRATGIVRTVAKEVAPGVVDAVDVNEVVERVDVQGVIDRIDVQGVVERVDANALLGDLDVQALLDRVDFDTLIKSIDIDALLAEVDMNALIDRIDVDRVLERVDIGQVLARIDIDALLARADLDQILARIDVNALIDRVDVERVIDKVDVNAVAQRVDFDAIVRKTEVGSIVAHSTTSILIKVVDVGRHHCRRPRPATARLGRPPSAPRAGRAPRAALADRILRRQAEHRDGRIHSHRSTLAADPASRRELERRELEGSYAGAVSRLIGYVIDVFLVTASFTVGATVFEYVVNAVLPVDVHLADEPIAAGIALAVWSFTYFTYLARDDRPNHRQGDRRHARRTASTAATSTPGGPRCGSSRCR